MRYLDVDSYGRCFKNRDIDASLLDKYGVGSAPSSQFAGDWQGLKQELASRYTFVLSIENSLSADYISEKPFDALQAGSIPLYLGAPNFNEFLPPGSAVDLRQFDSAILLGQFIENLAGDESRLAHYHRWRNATPREWIEHYETERQGVSWCSMVTALYETKCK